VGKSSIEWTDATWNPVRGCTRISPGCQNCYAEAMAARFSDEGYWGHGFAERTAAGGHWTGAVKLIPEKLAEPLSWKAPRQVFVNSTSDLFHERLPFEDIAAVYGVMMACQHISFQVLTKRAERRLAFHEWLRANGDPESICEDLAMERLTVPLCHLQAGHHGWPLPNVWEGVSAENQEYWDERTKFLAMTPAACRFVSAEPLLGPIRCRFEDMEGQIGWVIVGGESGHGARPFDLGWGRDIIAQCKLAQVPVFMKQVGSNPVDPWADTGALVMDREPAVPSFKDKKGGDPAEWPEDLRIREMPEVSRG
jgi:protein gp37